MLSCSREGERDTAAGMRSGEATIWSVEVGLRILAVDCFGETARLLSCQAEACAAEAAHGSLWTSCDIDGALSTTGTAAGVGGMVAGVTTGAGAGAGTGSCASKLVVEDFFMAVFGMLLQAK